MMMAVDDGLCSVSFGPRRKMEKGRERTLKWDGHNLNKHPQIYFNNNISGERKAHFSRVEIITNSTSYFYSDTQFQ